MVDKLGRYFIVLVIGAVAFSVLYNLYWDAPEKWNPTAKAYLVHVVSLKSDSTRSGFKLDSLGNVVKQKDVLIDKLTGEAKKALDYGNEWKGKFNLAVAESDANSDALTEREKEVAYYKALLKNGTLSADQVGEIQKLTPQNPLVVSAGLKTAARESVAAATVANLGQTVGYLQAANERLGKGLSTASVGLSQLSEQAKANQKGGIPILRRKRVRQAKAMQHKADSLKSVIDEVSDIEKELNKKL
ncbi:hypothetical protein [Spirosoma sp.]|uniref:hypothetical protein n=1 Tax=Spirosoma sp. TaxID=1899569 RepID=UPI002630E0CB|nr:hypothetical protein [Spirosoma sp.]MCX6218326.1 hypothetical protein [Spirosoma sp.]